jgi:hypothetical protein
MILTTSPLFLGCAFATAVGYLAIALAHRALGVKSLQALFALTLAFHG